MTKISLGGVGGCDLAEAIRMFDQPSFPYDWLITSPSFILQSFNTFHHFFEFNDEYVYNQTLLLEKNKKAIMLHDFSNFPLEKNNVLSKYQRRFDRLNRVLTNVTESPPILFVRINDNLKEGLNPPQYYDAIFEREEEDIGVWNDFIRVISEKYNKTCKLLFISSDIHHSHIMDNTWEHVVVRYTPHHKNATSLHQIIAQVEKDLCS
jgi:hypothetical protein